MKKSIWGKHIWYTMHYISLGYPDNPSESDKNNYKAFYLLIKDILPCKTCSQHYKENLLRIPLTDEILSNKELLINWVIDIHNKVNEITNKKILDYNDARTLIKNDIKCDHNEHSFNRINYLYILIINGLIIYIIYKYFINI